ncbi:MAG: ATP synthase subunit I [Deltaproteobacteria bacterium]|nr:ATP synthase subunit I [Deltaproteobacteria bacterium]MDO9209593.1 ATP synthase subunit I [Deltaproteobacteria bacterium]MDP3039263.1 ATP synthase subunit I [Deltaproteobacteria bacterium]
MIETSVRNKLPIPARQREIRKLASIEKRTAQVLALLLVGSLWFQSWSISLGLILGGGVAILNFHWLWRIMEKVIFEKKKIHGLQVLIKFLALLMVIFMIFRFIKVNSVAFIIGISTLLPGIFFGVIQESLRAERKGNG